MKKFLVFLIMSGVLMAGCVKDKPVPVRQTIENSFVEIVSAKGNIKFRVNPQNITVFADGGDQCIVYFMGTDMSIQINECEKFKKSVMPVL